ENLESAVTLGSRQSGPTADEVLQVLSHFDMAVVNLVGLPLGDRPAFFLALLPPLQEMRARTGRPHWLLVDEAHHLLPPSWKPGSLVVSRDLKQMLFITVHPDQMARDALETVDRVLAVGKAPDETIRSFCAALGNDPGDQPAAVLDEGQVYLWSKHDRAGQRV